MDEEQIEIAIDNLKDRMNIEEGEVGEDSSYTDLNLNNKVVYYLLVWVNQKRNKITSVSLKFWKTKTKSFC